MRACSAGEGRSSRLCYLGHALMKNRHALIVDTSVTLVAGTVKRGSSRHDRAYPQAGEPHCLGR